MESFYQGVLYFQNVVSLRHTRKYNFEYARKKKYGFPCPDFTKQPYVYISYRIEPNRTNVEKG